LHRYISVKQITDVSSVLQFLRSITSKQLLVLSYVPPPFDRLIMAANNSSVNGNAQGNAHEVVSRDPAVYAEYEKKWSSIPEDEPAWLQRVQEVADVLAADAGTRDKENKSPRAEVTLLKHGGLLKVLGPKKYGGGGQPWSVGYKLIRKIAEADG
jgi:hypothetical protein